MTVYVAPHNTGTPPAGTTPPAPASTTPTGAQTGTPPSTGTEAGTGAGGQTPPAATTPPPTTTPGTQPPAESNKPEVAQEVTQLQGQVSTLTKERDAANAARDAAVKERDALQAQLDEMKGMATATLEADMALLSEEQRSALKAMAADPIAQRKQLDFLFSTGLLKRQDPPPKGKVHGGISGSGEAGKPGAPKTIAEAAKRVREEARKKGKK